MLIQESVDLLAGVRGEGVDVVDLGEQGADAFLVRGVGGPRQ